MKRRGAEGPAAVFRSPAAHDRFSGMVNGADRLARPQSGWDPYEVWRSRVKGSSTVMQERERDPLHSPPSHNQHNQRASASEFSPIP
jgi:hypothetical protein